jgi:YfiR/HmsC-like
VICTYGANPFDTYIEEMAGTRRVKGRPIEFRTLTQLDGTTGCQILFVPATQRDQAAAVLARTAGKPILTVAESEGFAERGFLVNFYSSEDNLRFEINDGASRRSGLKISSKLMKLARVVNLEEPR